MADLETPNTPDSPYLARGVGATEQLGRPLFTGDVFQVGQRTVALVQHPCALRRGTELNPRLLVAEVAPWRGRVRDDWATGDFKRMFLENADQLGTTWSIEFDRVDVVEASLLQATDRVIILSQPGINLLLQRWLYHNSRTVVPTITVNAQMAGPFAEAELIQEVAFEFELAGRPHAEAVEWVDSWLSNPQEGGAATPRRVLLNADQARSSVRSSLRNEIRLLLAPDKTDSESPSG